MPEFHAEPFIYLPALTHKSALVAWGAFYFRVTPKGKWKLIDDVDLKYVHPPRKDSIGARSAPYGPGRVEVYDASGVCVQAGTTDAANHCWITGLTPDTEYTYKVFVKGEEWAQGERWDWSARDSALVQAGRRYVNAFRTFPSPETPATTLTFAVIGDFGVGVRRDTPDRRQRQVAAALDLAVAAEAVRFVITTGDNIYAGSKFLGIPVGQTGSEDDDWFFTYFQPYRYILNRIPVYPSIGNHDASESEDGDDRGQVEDNFYICERMAGEEAAGRASFTPGLFYRFRYGSAIEFVCLDTSRETFFKDHRLFDFPKHRAWVEASFTPEGPRWRIPFTHHPPYSAGPKHHNTKEMTTLLPLFQRAGVRVVFSGHEHNFQHSRVDGIDYLVSGAAGRARDRAPNRFEEAHTASWSAQCHFLLARIDDSTMRIRPIGELVDAALGLTEIERRDPRGDLVVTPLVVQLP
jgi:tartrate-resistant acid phosphatase type 5